MVSFTIWALLGSLLGYEILFRDGAVLRASQQLSRCIVSMPTGFVDRDKLVTHVEILLKYTGDWWIEGVIRRNLWLFSWTVDEGYDVKKWCLGYLGWMKLRKSRDCGMRWGWEAANMGSSKVAVNHFAFLG
jgi:hypothetical protein